MMGRRGGLYVMVSAVAVFVFFVWWPWLHDIRTGKAQLEQLQWAQQQRERTMRQALDQLIVERQQLEEEWVRLQSGLVVASSPITAGTEFLRHLQEIAQSAHVQVRSSALTPVDARQDPVRLTADIRGEGQREAVYEFVHRLSQGPPSYYVHRARFDRRPGSDVLSFELVLSALWSPGNVEPKVREEWARMYPISFSLEASRALSLFGTPAPLAATVDEMPVAQPLTYQTEWDVVGIVQGAGEAAAILRHPDGSQRVLRAGEFVGDEQVMAVEATYVVLERQGARSELHMPTELIAPWIEEVVP